MKRGILKSKWIKSSIASIMAAALALGMGLELRASGFEPAPIDELIANYDYDRGLPLNVEIELVEERPDFMYKLYHVTFDSATGERIPAHLYIPYIQPLPEDADARETRAEEIRARHAIAHEPPWPVVFFMHFHVSDKSLAGMFVKQREGFPKRGMAVFAIDGLFRGDRREPGRDIIEKSTEQTAANMQRQIFDILRGFDYLASRDDIDADRMGYFGISMGSFTGAVACAVDPRIKAMVFAAGGADLANFLTLSDYGSARRIREDIESRRIDENQLREMFQFVDPLYYAQQLAPRPVLLISATEDDVIPEQAIHTLHEIVAEPKKEIWYDSSHVLPPSRVIRDSLLWFQEHL